MKKIWLILIGIIIIASILRLWNIGSVPPSPDWDEAALGYNAYSLLLTGKDEYGKIFPVALRSFDDYKPALYAYFAIPFIKVFGLNIVSVRLVSAIFGIITVIAVFFLIKELFGKEIEISKKTVKADYLALIASFILAISPWSINFSRIAFESNVGAALNVLALLFFLKGLKVPKILPISFFFASINIYMYQSEKVFTVILFLILLLLYWKTILSIPKKYLLISFVLISIIVFPMVHYTITDKNALLRAKGVSVFSDQTQFLKRNVIKSAEDKKTENLLGLVLDNRRIEYGRAIVSGYISHFDINWLFITGDISRHHAPFMGLLYLIELPFLLLGIYILIFGRFNLKIKTVIFSYFLIAPLPASITSGVPHAVRTLNFLPVIQIFIALGILSSFIWALKQKVVYRYTFISIFSILFLFNFVYFLNQYFIQLNYFNSSDWQYGYEKVVSFVYPIQNRYREVVVSNVRPLDQSYMFFLFYLKYPPDIYQKNGGTVSGGFAEDHKGFANYVFRNIDWNNENKENKLFIGRPGDFPDGVKILKTVNYLDGKPAIIIVEG